MEWYISRATRKVVANSLGEEVKPRRCEISEEGVRVRVRDSPVPANQLPAQLPRARNDAATDTTYPSVGHNMIKILGLVIPQRSKPKLGEHDTAGYESKQRTMSKSVFEGFMLWPYPGLRLWLDSRCNRTGKESGDGTLVCHKGTGMMAQCIHERKPGN